MKLIDQEWFEQRQKKQRSINRGLALCFCIAFLYTIYIGYDIYKTWQLMSLCIDQIKNTEYIQSICNPLIFGNIIESMMVLFCVYLVLFMACMLAFLEKKYIKFIKNNHIV